MFCFVKIFVFVEEEIANVAIRNNRITIYTCVYIYIYIYIYI